MLVSLRYRGHAVKPSKGMWSKGVDDDGCVPHLFPASTRPPQRQPLFPMHPLFPHGDVLVRRMAVGLVNIVDVPKLSFT